jgi:hypothetical protein
VNRVSNNEKKEAITFWALNALTRKCLETADKCDAGERRRESGAGGYPTLSA